MENASKALLIAGAVLIVILLIGLGILIYSRSTGVVDTATGVASTQEILAYNSQFTGYEGTQKGSSVRSLLSTVIANEATYVDNPEKEIKIGIAGLSESIKANIIGSWFDANNNPVDRNIVKGSEKIAKLSSLLETSKSYKITLSYNDEGLINKIAIYE